MNMHLILNSSTGTLVTVAIFMAPDGGFYSKSVCMQTKPAHIPHVMLREVKVQKARYYQGGTPSRRHVRECLMIGEGTVTGQPRMISHQFVVAYKRGHISSVPPHFPHPKPQISGEI